MKTLRLLSGCAVGAVLLVMGLAQGTQAQCPHDARILIPVTFYDFRSDRSNPEFEQPHGKLNGSSQIHRPGMVEFDLDLDGKPRTKNSATHNGLMHRNTTDNPYLNYGMRFWFRDWNNPTAGSRMTSQPHQLGTRGSGNYLTKFRPVYQYRKHDGTWGPQPTVGQNTGWSDGNIRGGEWDAEEIRLDSLDYANPGNAFENRVIPANLVFSHVRCSYNPGCDGVYRFDVNGFFPLANGGRNPGGAVNANQVRFDREGLAFTNDTWASTTGNTGNNYSFTMEMECDFQMRSGLNFDFRGDDDVWVFINNRLALDIGGIHEAVSRNVRLNDLRSSHSLEDNKDYKLKMFYCERHADGSNIMIETNVVSRRINKFEINVSSDPMIAGVPKLATALVGVDTGAGVLKDFAGGRFTWSARDLGGYNTGTQLTVASATSKPLAKSDSINVTAQKAYTTVRIYGEYYDSTTMSTVRDSVDVWVGPGPGRAVYIEGSQDSTTSLRTPNPLAVIPVTGPYNDAFFGIVRDQFGNWVGTANRSGTLTWTTESSQIATAGTATTGQPAGYTAQHGLGRGQGKANRGKNAAGEDTKTGETRLTLSVGTLTPGTATIRLVDYAYDEISIGVRLPNGDFIVISSSKNNQIGPPVQMTAGSDTTFIVRLCASDIGPSSCVEGAANWTSSSIPGVPATAPGQAATWRITPTGATSGSGGRVTAAIPGTTTQTYVTVIVVNNDPVSMRFFPKRGPVGDGLIMDYILPNPSPAIHTPARQYVIPPASVTVTAGANLPLVAKMFSSNVPAPSTWLEYLEDPLGANANRWSWSWVAGSPTNARTTISRTTGDSVMFTSTAATYNSKYELRATYGNITQDIHITVVPNLDNMKLHIEPRNSFAQSPNDPMRMGTMTFDADKTEDYAYAILRDEYGNYVAPSGAPIPASYYAVAPPEAKPTAWSPIVADNKPISAVNGRVVDGEGYVTRTAASGTTALLIAHDVTWNKRDTVQVEIRDYGYTEIKIVQDCQSGSTPAFGKYCDIGTAGITMTTNDDKTVYAVGLRNDCGEPGKPTGAACWEPVVVNWGRGSGNLGGADGLAGALPNVPSGTSSWTLSPRESGEGQISATLLRNNKDDLKAEVDLKIKVGPPLSAEIVIITPPAQRIAGEEIKAIVQYYNRAGLMTEWDPAWTSQGAYFADTLGKGPTTIDPKVISANGEKMLYYSGVTGLRPPLAMLQPGVATGHDTVTFIIYYAAEGHQINFSEALNIAGVPKLTAVSEKFTVLAGPPADMVIVPSVSPDKVVNDTLRLSFKTDSDVVLRAVGVDKFGNPTGDVVSCWTNDSASVGIPLVKEACGLPLVVYNTKAATENGKVLVCAADELNPGVNACLWVRVSEVTALAQNATTKDISGLGYLTSIVVRFPRQIDLTPTMADKIAKGNAPSSTEINITNGGAIVKDWCRSIEVNGDSTVTLWLNQAASGPLQTGWKPTVTIGNGVFTDVDQQTVECRDGAAPVIASAKLFFDKNGNKKANYIDVQFSEPVRAPSGVSFSNATVAGMYKPEDLFFIYDVGAGAAKRQAKPQNTRLSKAANDAVNSLRPADPNPLAGLGAIGGGYVTETKDATTIRFFLENEWEPTPPRHYINIKTDDVLNPGAAPNPKLRDADGLPPGVLSNNRRVPIVYGNQPNEIGKVIPNPATPDSTHRKQHEFFAEHDEQALWKLNRGEIGGTVFQVPIYVPNGAGSKVKCQIKVYDLAGNLVNSTNSANAAINGLETSKGQPVKMDLYWNGFNSKRMKVAPGTYRIVAYISYDLKGNNEDDKKWAKNKKHQGIIGIGK